MVSPTGALTFKISRANRRKLKVAVLPRLYLCASSFAFVFALNYAHKGYLNPVYEFWGFPYYPLGLLEWSFLATSISFACLTLPVRIIRPSALVLFVLYLLVYLPSITITLAVKPEALYSYGYELVALVVGFCSVAIITRSAALFSKNVLEHDIPSRNTKIFVVISWLIVFFIILLSFRETIHFVGLEDIYQQRIAGRARNAIQAYSQSYLAYVLSPAIFALGLLQRNVILILMGLIGFLLMFGVTAERTIFLLPFAITGLYVVLKKNPMSATLSSWILSSLSVVIAIVIYFHESLGFIETLSFYLVFRVIAIPGAMFWQYSDVFSELGRTYWSNVKGISFLIDVPVEYMGELHWPQLGYIVAQEILNLESNSNANIFAYDGLAGAGALGIFFASFLLASWLVVFDRITRFADTLFVMMVTFPMAFLLTNGSIFSLLLSFGGIFWIVFFALSARRLKLC